MRCCFGCFENIKDDLEICPHCGYKEGTQPEEAIHMNPGTVLADRYTIGKVIGYGGFGVTYIGWDAKLEQKVAIKEYLPSEFSTRMPGQSKVSIFSGIRNEQFSAGLNRFVDEAKRLSKFQKEDGIVTIYDCIAENDTAYIIMEYLEGETLSERLKRENTIPEKEAIEIMLPVMKSLEVVHNEGIIHRDISPDNIFLTKDGKVKLIDFGAARFATTSHSRSLTVIIKPGYSAEEQYRSSSDQGTHTDVYSLGATLYRMITGITPPDALERRVRIENAKKDILTEPHKINKRISLVIENAILNALNIRIEDRTPTVQKLMSDLTANVPVKRIYGKIKRVDIYRIPVWLKILVPSLLVVFLMFGVLIAAGVIRINSLFKTNINIPDGYTVVPSIEGLSIEEATNQLTESKLNYITGGNVTSEYVAANLIVYQNPENGRVIPVDSTIIITVSRGTGIVEQAKDGISIVPVFAWSEEQTAVHDFETAGLKTRIEYIFDENVAAGQVIRATDEYGNEITAGKELQEGTTVILYVSKGKDVVSSIESSTDEIDLADSTTQTSTSTPIPTPTPAPTLTPIPTPEPIVALNPYVESVEWIEDSYEEYAIHVELDEWRGSINVNICDLYVSDPGWYFVNWESSNEDVIIIDEDEFGGDFEQNDELTEWDSTRVIYCGGSRGTSTITVTAVSDSGESVSTSFTVRVYDFVYGDWGPIQQSATEVEESDTVEWADPYEVIVQVDIVNGEPVYETRYQYQERERYGVSCESD